MPTGNFKSPWVEIRGNKLSVAGCAKLFSWVGSKPKLSHRGAAVLFLVTAIRSVCIGVRPSDRGYWFCKPVAALKHVDFTSTQWFPFRASSSPSILTAHRRLRQTKCLLTIYKTTATGHTTIDHCLYKEKEGWLLCFEAKLRCQCVWLVKSN